MIVEAAKPVPPATSACSAGFFPGHSGQRIDLYAKAPRLDQIGFSLTTSKLKLLPLPDVEFEPAADLQRIRGIAFTIVLPTLAGMVTSPLDCSDCKGSRAGEPIRHPASAGL